MDLNIIAKEIREILETKRQLLSLTFEEEGHIYTIKDRDGNIRTDFPSVSPIVDIFYEHFDSESKSFQMCNGDVKRQEKLLLEWKKEGDRANSMGSMVHYNLEKYAMDLYDNYKEVREPIFECDKISIIKANRMIIAGQKFIQTMHQRGAVLLDTETVLGSNTLEYTGQPDKIWLIENEGVLGLIIGDWKTNKKKNFEVHSYTNKMYEPFEDLDNNALGHYSVQLPLYGKLLLDMLKGTKYENIKIFGYIIVRLKDDETYEEYRISKKIYTTIHDMDINEYLEKVE